MLQSNPFQGLNPREYPPWAVAKNPATSHQKQTSVSLAWLAEQLAACAARQKWVVLDTRQVENAPTADDVGVAAGELIGPLRGVPGLTVLAASARGQASRIGDDRCSPTG